GPQQPGKGMRFFPAFRGDIGPPTVPFTDETEDWWGGALLCAAPLALVALGATALQTGIAARGVVTAAPDEVPYVIPPSGSAALRLQVATPTAPVIQFQTTDDDIFTPAVPVADDDAGWQPAAQRATPWTPLAFL